MNSYLMLGAGIVVIGGAAYYMYKTNSQSGELIELQPINDSMQYCEGVIDSQLKVCNEFIMEMEDEGIPSDRMEKYVSSIFISQEDAPNDF